MAIAGLLSGGVKLLAGASKASGAVRTGAGLASNMMKRKKVNSGALVKSESNKNQENISRKGGALVKSNVSLAPTPVVVSGSIIPTTSAKSKGDVIEEVKVKVIEIDKLLKGSFVTEKKRIDLEKKEKEKESRKGEEEELESKPAYDKDKKKKSKNKLPKIGFFERIKKFIMATILAFILPKLIDYLPQLVKFLSVIVGIGDFIIDIGGKILNGLITLVDWGYKVYDSARGFIGDKLGDKAKENFDSLMKNVNTMLNLALIAAMGALAFRPDKPKTPKGGDGAKPRKGQIIDTKTGKIRKKTKVELNLQKKFNLTDDQIKAYQKARQGGANTRQALAQARKVKPKPKPTKPKGFFGKLFESAKESVKTTVRKFGSGLNKISGGRLGKLGDALKNQYESASSFVKNKYDKVVSIGDSIKNKFAEKANKLKDAAAKVGDSVKKKLVEAILKPLEPIFKPVLNKVKGIGDSIMKQLSKIPGFDNVTKVLQKNGIQGMSDAKGLLKKVGPKAIPILGGLVNLLFAYDRLAQGDIIGGLLEATSGILDVSGAFGFAPGPIISMGMDAYLFARDFIPQIQEGEEKVVNALGLGGIKGQISELAKKLPDLSEIVGGLMGKNENKKAWWDPMGVFTGKAEKKVSTPTTTPTTAATNKYVRDSSSGGTSRPNVGGLPDRPKTIYLHWTAGGYNSVVGPYHTVFTGDGKMHRKVDYNQRSGHTYNRNSNSVGLSLASMGGGSNESNMSQAPTDAQLNAMSAEAAKLATNWGWSKSDINLKNVMTHGEAGSNLDGRNMHENYGPSVWGGTGERWDLDKLRKGQSIGQGGPEMRERIKAKMFTGGLVKGTKGRDRVPTLLTHGEFVIDADSTKAIESTFPGFLDAINKADGKMAIDTLRNYAEYEMSEVITVPIEVPVPITMMGNRESINETPIIAKVSFSDGANDILYMR